MATKEITLKIAKKDIAFNVDTDAYHRYINELKPDSKTVPSTNFLRRTLADEANKPLLNDAIDAGFAVDMAGMLLEEFRGELEIEVKK